MVEEKISRIPNQSSLKKEFELIKMQAKKKEQLNYSLVNFVAEYLSCADNLNSLHK